MTATIVLADTPSTMAEGREYVNSELPSLLSEWVPTNDHMLDSTADTIGSLLDDSHASRMDVDAGDVVPLLTDGAQQVYIPAGSTSRSTSEQREWIVLPDGLLWHSYLAGPQEPRISALLLADEKGGYFWDATLGGRVGFLRYGTPGAKDPHGWQWDLEGAAITRLNLLEQTDVESVDYRFGTELTWAEGPWAMKAGYFHISSHVGDEYLVRNPTFERINYVTESLIWGISYKPTEPTRVYGEVAYAVHRSGGARPFQFQTGAEWTPPPNRPRGIAPFAAANLGFFEATEFHMQTTIQAGWGFQGPQSGRRLRFGLQYGDGPSNQFEFYTLSQEYLGWGIWFDY
ncbi:DUF1207 domain-containing protein [Allorhodopirellula heiligendammensis]|uniref:DUF1207 domain-containing protein n=1 Tax=Allorhodopirellula heiligendammensis TaxID=2714739 RepID=UPI00265FFC5D|nr:DUF1207 domain-containing protein [Allorhodopirellula heiligendammensis]